MRWLKLDGAGVGRGLRRPWFGVWILSLVAVVAAGCGSNSSPSSSSSSGALASSQVLKFPIYADPQTMDPALGDQEIESEIAQNVFDNLWRFDDKLNIVPDLATTVPTTSNGGISSDGMTYTVHLNPAAKFNNGDAVTAQDVIYSWDRAAAYAGAYSGNLAAIQGFGAVQAAAAKLSHTQIESMLTAGDTSLMMSGLSAPDSETVQIKLGSSCGWCLAAWTLQDTTGAVVDPKVVAAAPDTWWNTPVGGPGSETGMVGTGAYELTAYTPKQSMTFKLVPSWWGTAAGLAKPTLTEIDIDIHDPSASEKDIAAWEQGSYDIFGYGGYSAQMTVADVKRIQATSSEKSELLSLAKGRTTWLSFNIGYPATGGPFVGESAAAQGLRMAFDLAINKQALAATACGGVLCSAATSGLISPGLVGNLGAGNDPLADFNPTKAKQLLKEYDPTGQLTANLKYSYNSGGINDPVATDLQEQWKTNLGINVTLDPNPDSSAFIKTRLAGGYVMSRDGWQFDYNSPQDWYDNLWGKTVLSEGANTSGFDVPQYDTILAQADQEPTTQALTLYNQLAKLLITDVAYIPLYYAVGNFLIHSYVKGAGSNTQADYYWDEISLLAH
ncbi:MAG: ABC transporter substrate-binding protein [Candidatus Dormiibacterota bacterium]